ncbi:MAG: membrane protein insertion efficiency factor YidD [Gemmatimonadota bacterium]
MKTILFALIRTYQIAMAWSPSPCRYEPSCSRYALDAVAAHGAWRGTLLAARRLVRCHPWHAGGYDPVPPAGAKGAGPR